MNILSGFYRMNIERNRQKHRRLALRPRPDGRLASNASNPETNLNEERGVAVIPPVPSPIGFIKV